ncbi:MAG: DUF4347 domain-containing protein [Bacteroidales bacterium]|nr:DUF4347 domain-containing protein [Bacteroidales bacterium]
MKRIRRQKTFILLFSSILFFSQLTGQEFTELVVLDETVISKEAVINCLRKNIEILILPAGVNQLQELTEKLKNYKNLEAIHLLVCGKDGVIMLNESPLQNQSISMYSKELGLWKESCTPTCDLMIYTCSLAESDEGKLIIRRLAAYTGLDVAASTNVTGNLEEKGDWKLEFMKGKIETTTCFNTEKLAVFSDSLKK